MKVKALFAVRVENEDWQEELITEQADQIAPAKEWAKSNGFNRFRVIEFDDSAAPDFGASSLA